MREYKQDLSLIEGMIVDINAIKKFATWARVELIDRISKKAEQLGVTEKKDGNPSIQSVRGCLLSAKEQVQRTALIARVITKGWQQTIEDVACTWFIILCALRYMEVNRYLPSHVRFFTDDEGKFNPQILTNAMHLEWIALDKEKVKQCMEQGDREKLFKYLLITQCNALNDFLPQIFQHVEGYTELLLPDNLLQEGSVVEQLVTLIPEEEWKDQVQIIGWLYQYYNEERRDQVINVYKKKIIEKEDIPAATQLFTPDWVVRYMVENSLGRLWIEREWVLDHSTDKESIASKFGWQYYMKEAEQELDELARQRIELRYHKNLRPEDIRCIDPCMGSGHILVYMFDVLMQIYQDYGYSARDAVRSVLENNLYGLDIDDRAAQLAYFAVMMKASQYDRGLLSRTHFDGSPDIPQPNVYPMIESDDLDADQIAYFVGGDAKLKESISTLIEGLKGAKEYGSLLTVSSVDFHDLYVRFDEIDRDVHFLRDATLKNLLPFVRQVHVLSERYHVVVTNPPYLNKYNDTLKSFVRDMYKGYSADLFSCFMYRNFDFCLPNGYSAFMTPFVWMFIKSYEKLRDFIISEKAITCLIQMEYSAFEQATVPVCAFVLRNGRPLGKGHYLRLSDFRGGMSVQNEKVLEAQSDEDCAYRYFFDQENFTNIPSSPVAYWASEALLKAFEWGKRMDCLAEPKVGLQTGSNDRFLRQWYEVTIDKISFNSSNATEALQSSKKWFPYNKGGERRQWYGNYDYLVNWENDGYEIKNFFNDQGRRRSGISNPSYYFREAITWGLITSGGFSIRYRGSGGIHDVAGMSAFTNDHGTLLYLLALMSTHLADYVFDMLNPTLNLQVGNFNIFPVLEDKNAQPIVNQIAEESIILARDDWDQFETSWDFKCHPMVSEQQCMTNTHHSLVSCKYDTWKAETYSRFAQLKTNEEDLNRIFIDMYGLQDELSSEVEVKDVTVYRIIDEPGEEEHKMRYVMNKRDAIISLISYAVGCMFGRYSLDAEGLILAGQSFSERFYFVDDPQPINMVRIEDSPPFTQASGDCYIFLNDGSVEKCTFVPERDNIIPITEERYFSDDIVSRFVDWVRAAYGEETLEENLLFVADALGGSGTPRNVIREYFLKDFYQDHVKTYKKRPIYWLFDSGRRNGFKALIYMHRYTPDTITRLRTDYVHELQTRYDEAMVSLAMRMDTATEVERTRLNRQLIKMTNQVEELRQYDEKIHHLADQMIEIDLDDGVKHNYAIFKDVLAKI